MSGVEIFEKMKNVGAERTVLGIIMKNGRDGFIEADSYLNSSDFSNELNITLYKIFKELSDKGIDKFDLELIKIKAKELNKSSIIEDKKAIEFILLLNKCSASLENTKQFAEQIKKYSVIRELYKRHLSGCHNLENLSGNESISDILTYSEEAILNFVNGASIDSDISRIADSIESYVESIMENEIVDQIGIPTGFKIWDKAIGGGARPGTVPFIVARAKTGKSAVCMNMARNTAKRGIPSLVLDSEMTEDYQKARLISIDSGCPITSFETGTFKRSREMIDRVKESARRIAKYPLYYRSTAGMGPTEIQSTIRRWIVKHVGFGHNGKANPCIIYFDYLKLTSGESLTKYTPEYIILGLVMTELSNLAIKYGVPIIVFGQSNREGIDGDDTNVIAGSDRILWLCSSMSIIKNKTEEDVVAGCGWDHGNKKLLVKETRQGAGLKNYVDYINLRASLRPGVDETEATGLIVEGLCFSDIVHNTAIK